MTRELRVSYTYLNIWQDCSRLKQVFTIRILKCCNINVQNEFLRFFFQLQLEHFTYV